MYKEDPTQGIPDWLQPSTVHLEDLKKCARKSFWKSELRFGRCRFKSGDRKRSIPLAEEICDTKRAEHNSESRNSHQFAAVVQDLTDSVDITQKNLRKISRAVAEAKSYWYEPIYGI